MLSSFRLNLLRTQNYQAASYKMVIYIDNDKDKFVHRCWRHVFNTEIAILLDYYTKRDIMFLKSEMIKDKNCTY